MPQTETQRGATRPWYAGGLRFACRRCGRCCRGTPGYVWVTRGDLARFAAYLQVEFARLETISARRVGRRISLRERANGDCVFYADGCLVYPVRPGQCRTFPFWRENLTSRKRWEEVRRACPGISDGVLRGSEEIDLLLRRRRRPRGAVPAPLRRAFRRLRDLYRALEARLAPLARTCAACGACCDFRAKDHVLYVTELERSLLVHRTGLGAPGTAAGCCPYQAGALCTAREVRPLGCRTFYCQREAGAAGRLIHEEFLSRMAPLREASGLPLAYGPLLPLERERQAPTEVRSG